VVGNPTATFQCASVEFYARRCPSSSMVGVATVLESLNGALTLIPLPIYNLVPPRGSVVDLAFEAAKEKVWVHIGAHVRTGGDYGVTSTSTNVSELAQVLFTSIAIWGVPAEH